MKCDTFSLIVEGITSMRSAPHFQCLLENVNDCDDHIKESGSVPPTCLNWKVVQGSARLIGARHISSPLKWSETTLGCAAADRAVVEGPELASGHRDGDDISPKALGPVSGRSAVLGRNALEGRATAFEPDGAHIVRAPLKVNPRYCGFPGERERRRSRMWNPASSRSRSSSAARAHSIPTANLYRASRPPTQASPRHTGRCETAKNK
jgi:hypothetical protein